MPSSPSSERVQDAQRAASAAPGQRRRAVNLALTAVILAGLGALDAWLTLRQEGEVSASGLLAGMCAMGLLGVLYAALARRATGAAVVQAAVLAVGEFIFGVLVLAIVLSAVIVVVPDSVASKLTTTGLLGDVVVFGFTGLALWVAGRSWWQHAARQAEAARSEVREAQALALAAERGRELARSELQVLHAQVEPHFLWNTLGNVQHLIRKDPELAARLTGLLIRYLRSSLPRLRQEASSLEEEFASARTYLELMRIRMGERLSIAEELPDELRQEPLAPLLLQTLVENAVKHGVEPKVGSVCVRIGAAALPDGRMAVEVADNGVGLKASAATAGTGLGLRSVRERLQLMHGDLASLSIAQAPTGGVVARMVVPRRVREGS